MKSIITLFLISFLATSQILAQISVGANTIPGPGDSLITCTDNLPVNLNLIGSGGPYTWDFRGLQAPFARRVIVQGAAKADLPVELMDASFVTEFPSLGSTGYFRSRSDRLELIGISGAAPEGLDLDAVIRFDPPAVERWVPLNYRDNRDQSYSYSFAFPASVLPSQIVDSLPIQPDSFRLSVQIERNYDVDAWGEMLLPDGTYSVLREKRTELRKFKLEAYFPVLMWVTLSNDLIPVGTFGPEKQVSYHFFSDRVKETVAIVSVDSLDRPIAVEYKSKGVITDVRDNTNLRPGVIAYPNPAITQIRFDFNDLRPGAYRLTIYNVLGQALWQNRYQINRNTTEKVELTGFRKGTYLYSLKEEATGKLITARRFIIIRP